MNPDDLDPQLLSAFSEADAPLPEADFSAVLHEQLVRQQRRRRFWRVAALGLLGVVALAIGLGLADVLTAFHANLIPIENPWASIVLAPINSVYAVLVLPLLGVAGLLRKTSGA